eukprot:11316738-Alexandrium_andersonii.AAC.1
MKPPAIGLATSGLTNEQTQCQSTLLPGGRRLACLPDGPVLSKQLTKKPAHIGPRTRQPVQID